MSPATSVQPDISADPDLEKVLDIARHIGAASHDDVNISYTSLFIGIMWSGDPTSLWLQRKLDGLSARKGAVYSQRRMDETQRESILAKVEAGETAVPMRDSISISAQTVLSEAQSLATEVGLGASEPLGTRHVAAVYFFRNPPGHNPQFHAEWGFDKDAWRREFAEFIASSYPDEEPRWAPVLAGYASAADPASHRIPGRLLADFRFDTDCVGVLRALETAVASNSPPMMTSGALLEVLASARALPDCAAFADLAADRLKIEGTVALPDQAQSFEGSGSSFATSRGFKNILDRARSLSRSTTGSDAIGVRHMIASILVDPDSTANQRLQRSGVSLPLLREKLLKAFGRRWLNDDGPQWQQIMVGSTLPTIAEIHPDVADRGEDRLDVGRYARAFATVIAADRVNPPLSVGIFGDWGSGKSFFMRLMGDQTQKLCALADTGADGKRLFCERVVSIRFNAWHYAEGQLLASLVQTILEGLRNAIVGAQGDSDLMDVIMEKLEIAKLARGEAEDRLKAAKQEEETSRTDLEEAQEEARKSAAAITLKPRDVVEAVRKATLSPVRMDEAAAVAEDLGLDGAGELSRAGPKTAGQVMTVINDARVISARARSTWDWLLRAPVNWRELRPWVIGVALVLVAGGAAAIWSQQAWPAFYGLVINVVGIAALAAKWARGRLSTVSRGLDQLDEIRRQIDGMVAAELSKDQAEMVGAQERYQAAVAKVAEAEARLKEAEAAIAKAERDVLESRSISRIARLLDDRLNRKSYERYLGIVAAVRADFQRLSDLMKSLRADRGANVGKLQPVERIVLYIDDLDRCPSGQVVAVLEAIHLLLAFELFIVVVGVDIRWAAKSLVEKYPRHLKAGVYEGGKSTVDEEDGVSALDYLEKIFQIPFWLPPMEEDCSRNMIAEMVPRVVEAGARESVASGGRSEDLAQGQSGSAGNGSAAGEASIKETATNAKSLVIEAEERNFMLQLAGAVGKSPRRLKRFVNTYRILKASLDNLQQETFVVKGGSQGEYRAAMTLLAMVTAAPRGSLGLLDLLAQSDESAELGVLDAYIATSQDRSEARYAQAALQAYRNAETGANIKLLRDWAPQVARFSFRSGRV